MDQPKKSILIASSSMTGGQHLGYVDEEIQKIRDIALNDAVKKGFIHPIYPLSGVTYQSLSDYLNSEPGKDVNILHYSGHSSHKGIWVQWEDTTVLIEQDPLYNLISNYKKLQLVFLNSCYSESIAKKLVKGGVPYVVGTTHKIGDQKAAIVAQKFYEFLAGNPPREIPNAFNETKDFFLIQGNNKTETSYGNTNRKTVDAETDEDDLFPWHIYFDEDLLSKDARTWTLVPRNEYQRVLSVHENRGNKIKIFCIYPKEDDGPQYYEAFKSRFNQDDNNYLIHGLWEMFPKMDIVHAALKEELEAADIIFHFVNGNEYANLINRLNFDFGTCNKTHLKIFIKNLPNPPRKELNNSWFQNSIVIESVIPNKMKSVEDIICSSNQKANPENVFRDFFEKDVLDKLNSTYIDINKFKRDIKTLNFSEEEAEFKRQRREECKLNFILIEGSKNCAQPLLTCRIQSLTEIKNHTSHPKKIKFTNLSSDGDFWKNLYIQLTEGLVDNYRDIDRYVDDIIKLVYQKLKMQHVVIVFIFEDQEESSHIDLYRNTILENFWPKFSAKFFDYEKNLVDPPSKKVFVFAVNNNYRNNKGFEQMDRENERICQVKIPPISKLKESEFVDWFNNVSGNYENTVWPNGTKNPYERNIFFKLNGNAEKFKNEYRKIAIANMLETLNINPLLLDEIVCYE